MQDKVSSFRFDQLTEIDENHNIELHDEAKDFLLSHKWCKQVIRGWQDENLSILDKLGVFLFKIEPIDATVDDYVWVMLGDLPSVYLHASVKTARDGLEVYCDLMNEWADNILQGHSLDESYPVEAEPTTENANLLKRKVAFIQRELLKDSGKLRNALTEPLQKPSLGAIFIYFRHFVIGNG
jgi:hypothetical protein